MNRHVASGCLVFTLLGCLSEPHLLGRDITSVEQVSKACQTSLRKREIDKDFAIPDSKVFSSCEARGSRQYWRVYESAKDGEVTISPWPGDESTLTAVCSNPEREVVELMTKYRLCNYYFFRPERISIGLADAVAVTYFLNKALTFRIDENVVQPYVKPVDLLKVCRDSWQSIPVSLRQHCNAARRFFEASDFRTSLPPASGDAAEALVEKLNELYDK